MIQKMEKYYSLLISFLKRSDWYYVDKYITGLTPRECFTVGAELGKKMKEKEVNEIANIVTRMNHDFITPFSMKVYFLLCGLFAGKLITMHEKLMGKLMQNFYYYFCSILQNFYRLVKFIKQRPYFLLRYQPKTI